MASISLPLNGFTPKTKWQDGLLYLWDVVRKKWLRSQPEEWVRQWILLYMIHELHYPAQKMAVEKAVSVFGKNKRFDIVVYDADWKPWLIVECKAPDVDLSANSLHQLLQYQSTLNAPYWLLTNGIQTYCANAAQLPQVHWMQHLPTY